MSPPPPSPNEMKWSEMCVHMKIDSSIVRSTATCATDDNGAHKNLINAFVYPLPNTLSRICRDKVKKQKEKEMKRAQIIT